MGKPVHNVTTPATEDELSALLKELAALRPSEYARRRKGAARELGVPLSNLDYDVRCQRESNADLATIRKTIEEMRREEKKARRGEKKQSGTSLIQAACADGDIEAIRGFSGSLWGQLIRRDNSIRAGQTHVGGTALHRNFAYRMVLACHRQSVPLPQELVELLQLVLGQDRPPSRRERAFPARCDAVEYCRTHPDAGVREIARAVSVSASTVSRWIKDKKI